MLNNVFLEADKNAGLSMEQIRSALVQAMEPLQLKKVLILPPDISRSHSLAGPIVCSLYAYLEAKGVQVDIMPALGSHVPMASEELDEMYPGIPHHRFFVHDWRKDTIRLGSVPGEVTDKLSEGLYRQPVPVEINRRLLDKSYDLLLSVGQVVPHEVVGMANYNKNIFVGCGGSGMISASHFMGALYGMERMMGRDHSPIHRLFDYAQEHFLQSLPLVFLLTVTVSGNEGTSLRCLSMGSGRDCFEKAIAVSQRENITYVDRPVRKVVAYLDEKEFKRTWIANKAIYRTRMMLEDGGELLAIAPGLCGCGEDEENDRLLRKYGYVSKENVLDLIAANEDLRHNLSAAAHIIHSSPEGRFTVRYAPGHLSREEIEGIGFQHMALEDALEKYPTHRMKPGFQVVDGEEIYYVPNPATGLWALRSRFTL